MNKSDVFELIGKFEASSLSELSIEMEGVKLSVKKGGANVCASQSWSTADAQAYAQEAVLVANCAASTAVTNTSAQSPTKSITAPLVGTFYRAAAPGEKPFVEIGQKVKKGDVIGIIEAMKLMNEIIAEEDGVVCAIEAEDGYLVEYGQILMSLS